MIPDYNCLVKNLGGLNNLRGKLDLYGLDDVEDMDEASKAKLCMKPNLQSLVLDWDNYTNVMEDKEYNDEEVMEGLKSHANLKELKVEYFKGKQFASWITMMTNLVKITLRYCRSCDELPTLGHLPKLKEMEINRMKNVNLFGNDFYRGLGSGDSEFTASEAKIGTTLYPSLTKLRLLDLPKLEEWLEPVMSKCGEEQSTMLAFPKLEVLEISGCSKLTRIRSSCFPSLKQLTIADSDSSSGMILETISRNVGSLTYLRLENISKGRGGSSSNLDSIIDHILKNNFMSLATLKLFECKGLTSLNLTVAIEKLEVSYCHDLTSINVVEESGVLTYVTIWGCPSLLNWASG